MNRRDLMKTGTALAVGAAAQGALAHPAAAAPTAPPDRRKPFWPGGAQLAISISMQFEATAQGPDAEGPFPPLDKKYPDTITPSWYRYGMLEGVPRLLDLWDKHGVKVTSHMVGRAVELNPDLAREVVRRGHEAAEHGYQWVPQYTMGPDDERKSYEQSAAIIEKVTGQRPVGFNAFWMRHTRHTLEILQDLGYRYHIDDLSRDEPSFTPVRGKPFTVVPYTLRMNDIGRFGGNTAMTGASFLQELKDEFDVLYAEGARRRRMMSVSTHDRIAGQPAIVKALDDFIGYAKRRKGVVFMRKDEIAKFVEGRDDVPTNPARDFADR